MAKLQMRIARWLAGVMAMLSVALAVDQLHRQPTSAQEPRTVDRQDSTEERTRDLAALFSGLKTAGSDEEADELVAKIWEVWSRSGGFEVDRILEEGIGYLAIRQLGPAHDRFTEAITTAPNFAEAWNKRATVLYLMGEHEQSLSDIERVLALEPRHFGALAGRGMIHAHAGRWQDALVAFRQALAVNPFLKERATVIPELERRVGEKPL